MTPNQIARREKILRVTREQVARHGYESLSIRDLADQAGVSPTTLYNLFDNKDGLVLASLQSNLERIDRTAIEEGESVLDFVIRRARVTCTTIIEVPKYSQAIARLLFTAEPSDQVVQLVLATPASRFLRYNRLMRQDGTLRNDVKLEELARVLSGSNWATILMWMKGFIALHEFEREFLTGILLPLRGASTPNGAKAIDRILAGLYPDKAAALEGG